MVFDGKRLLILGGNDVHNKVVECAKEMGIYTIVTDYYDTSPAKQLADLSLNINAVDTDAIVEWCDKNRVDGIINCCNDPIQVPYQKICDRLGLPCTANKEQFETMTNKVKFKEFCSRCGVGIVPEYTIDDILGNRVSYPIIIKPTDSRGSRGQTICYSQNEALCAIDKAKVESSDGKYICEKYMENYHDVSNVFFVVDSEPYLIKFGDRYLGAKDDNLDRQAMCTRLPSIFSNAFKLNSLQKVKNMIKKLGIRFGPVFLQGFVDEYGNVFYYDPGLRMPGGDYERILKFATGFDVVKSLIHFAITGDCTSCYGNPKDAYLLKKGKAFILDISAKEGTISRITGIKDLLNESSIVYYRQILHEGDTILPTGDVKQRVSEVGGYLSPNESLQDYIQFIYNNYHIYDGNGDDMIVSRVENIV